MPQEPVALAKHFWPAGVADLAGSDKDAVLGELCALTERHENVLDGDAFRQAIFEREKLVSTGIGIGVAVPHVKIASVTDYVVTVGRSQQGIDYDAIDGAPVHLVFMIGASEKQTAEFVRVLAAVVKLVKQPEVHDRLMAAAMPEEFFDVLTSACA